MSSDNASINITVEPPSRPDSNTSQRSMTQTPHLLSASFDGSQPLPATPISEPEHNRPVIPTLTSLSLPINLPDGQLPPGFIPMGPPTPLGSHPPGALPPYMTPSAVPLPPSLAPSTQRLFTNTPSVVGSVIPGGFTGLSTTDPVVIPLPPSTIPSIRGLRTSQYGRSALLNDSYSDEDDGASSTSTDTLTTPPHRRKRLPASGPSYATAPTPPDVVYPLPAAPPTPRSTVNTRTTGSRAAKVPLPPSSVGSPRSVYTRLSRKAGSLVGSVSGRA